MEGSVIHSPFLRGVRSVFVFLSSSLASTHLSAQQLNVIPQVYNFTDKTIDRYEEYPIELPPGDESYLLSFDSSGKAEIKANSEHGRYYANITLQHLSNSKEQLRNIAIMDKPLYLWRGMHLDVSRHFFSKEVIKKYLDLMAQLKLNVFHWHLTDDQGWRLEIKKYPRLTEIGAWRTEKDGSKYGGYYTQEDIKEIVAYAAERFITVVPEIEMPGHSSAAIAAYPELSCQPGDKTVPHTWGIKKDIYCPSEYTFNFLQGVLDEVCKLFPGKYIHIGGDEVPKHHWKKNETALALMKKENLKNPHQLETYFMKRIEEHLAAKGKNAIAWGEVMKGSPTDTLTVMSWMDKRAGKKAARKGNPVIMTPRFYCYFDYPKNIKNRLHAIWMTYVPLRKCYRFSPACKSLTAEENKRILGGQANVWTEYIKDEKQLHHQVYPRLAAIAEALWSGGKDYKDFKRRLKEFRF